MNNTNEFISIALNSNKEVEAIIDARKSESTNSYYFIIKTTDNSIYQLAFSDHDAESHDKDIYDIDLETEGDFDDLKDELMKHLGILDDESFWSDITDTDYFAITEAVPYNIKAEDIIGKHSVARAFVNDDDVILDAKLSEDNRVMTVKYADETRIYVNFEPSEFADDADIALIHFLTDEYDVHTARKYYYNRTITIEEGNEAVNDDELIYSYDGKDYIVDTSLLSLID